MEHFRQRLVGIVGRDGVRTGADVTRMDPGFDAGNLGADLAVLPRSSDQVADVLRLCNEYGVTLVAQGGRTGLSGAAESQAGQVILLTDRLNAVQEIDPLSRVAVVECGVTLESLESAAREHDLTVGIDLGARGSATLGGMASTNAGGNEAFRNGVMRQRVLGLEAVLPDGDVLSDLTRVIKVTDGYDLKQLFIGAEGTLGIITRLVVKLEPLLPVSASALVACTGVVGAVDLVNRASARSRCRLLAAECMCAATLSETVRLLQLGSLHAFASADAGPLCLLLEVATAAGAEDELEALLGEALEAGEAADALIAKNETERANFWLIREDWAVERAYPHGAWYDVTVPLGRLDTYLETLRQRLATVAEDLRLFFIGHLADGNLHLTVTRGVPLSAEEKALISDAVYRGLRDLGGALSAEHGIGIEKKADLERHGDPTKLALMRRIKRVLDPNGIMNPGKVV